MNDYFQENKRSLLILSGLLLLLAIVLYFILLRPLTADLSSKEKDIQSVQDEIQLLEAKLENMNDVVSETDVDQLVLEKRIPLERELDEYIASIQRLETISTSKISNISFVYDSNLEMDEEEEQAKTNTDELADLVEDEEDADDDTEEVEALKTDPEILKEKPEELQVMTVRVTGAVKEFDDMINLLEAIEKEDRISIVSRLTFSRPTEEEEFFGEYEDYAISFEAELSTFYYEE